MCIRDSINQDLTRYELHRVWVVEAKLKPGTSHIYPRRTFYVDEDSWQVLAVDQYDSHGQLWRVSEAHCINYYEVPTFWSTLEVHTCLLYTSPSPRDRTRSRMP